MMRTFIFVLAVFLILPFTSCDTAKEPVSPLNSIKTYKNIPDMTDDDITEIETLLADRGKFTYGALLATEAFELPDGTLAGFTKEFCTLLSELFETDFEFKLYDDWDMLMDDFKSGVVDFTGELTPTEERMKVYSMTPPIAERMLRIFTHTDSGIKTETDINGLKIGFLTDSVTADSILATYRLSFTCVDIENYEEAAKLIKNGEIAAFVDEAVADPVFSEYGYIYSQIFFPMVHAPVSMATANSELTPLISAVSKYIDAGGLDKLYELYKNGDFEYARYKLNQSFTSEEKAYIDDLTRRGATVAVAYEHDNYPVDFYNKKDDAYEGIAVDVLFEISRLTGLRFEPAVTKDATWAEIYEKLNAGEIHMVAQLLFSEARRDHFLWSAVPYAQSYYALMSKSDYPNLAAYQVAQTPVGAMKGSGKIDIFYELFPDHAKVIEYDTQYECLDALERGEIDLLMASEYMLLTQINYREKSGFKINIKLDAPLDSHFGFHKEDVVLCSIIDKAQKYVNTGTIEISWTGRSFDYSKRLAEEQARLLAIFLAVMFLILAVTVFVLLKNVKLRKRLQEIASHDALTGIFNRRYFLEQAHIQIARSLRLNHECFITIFDLDHFKAVNDTYGHLAGDQVLREIAQRVKKTIRPYDLLGRYGGEEFIMLMCDVDKENAINAVERVRQEVIKTPVDFESLKIPITASFGIAPAAPENDLTSATKYADVALYRAKDTGRNRVVFFEQ